MILLTASTSPKLSLAALIMKLFAVKKRPDKNAIVFPQMIRVIRPSKFDHGNSKNLFD